ncbi:sperm tail-domain-containing protein [Chytridium lagenaria]|nr:sperm tail-domain-containing protein [Chytridium lagenaria]
MVAGGPASDMHTSGLAPDASREARIGLRKARIEASRIAKLKPDKIDENAARRKPKAEPETKETGKAKYQITASSKRIELTKQSTTDLTTNVRVGIVARETVRRFEEGKKVDIWERKRNEEAAKSDVIREEVLGEWDKLLELKGPYELNEALLKQKNECDAFITSKNRLMNEYITELKSKDDEYVKELKRQAEELSYETNEYVAIDTLLERMESQYKIVQTTLKEELEQIEKSFVEERSELIESNLKEVETSLQQRRSNESKYMEERADRIEDHIKQLELLRVRDAEEYNLVKINSKPMFKYWSNNFSRYRFAFLISDESNYQLNTEKLEYNFQVLKKREEENGTILSTQKRKITRLTYDHLNMLKSKMAKQEKTFQQEYVSLTDDYKRITEQFKELQKKFRHFRASDNKKYQEIWRMNEELTKELMRKVLQADRIIHEQQLGLNWTPPDESVLEEAPLGNACVTATAAEEDHSMEIAATITAEGLFDDQAQPDKTKESLATKFKDHNRYSKNMKRMLELLCNEAGFLVEDKLQKLLAPLHRDEQSLMKLDSIFKALRIETVEDIEKLTSYFVARETEPVESGNEPTLESQRPGTAIDSNHHHDDVENTTLIHPNDVVKAIRRFVEDQKAERQSDVAKRRVKPISKDGGVFDMNGEAFGGNMSDSDHATSPSPNPTTHKSKSELQRAYWLKMSNILDDKSYRIWTVSRLRRHGKIQHLLSQRWDITQEITSIRSQNDELKSLLRQYMSAKVNDELQAGMLDRDQQ